MTMFLVDHKSYLHDFIIFLCVFVLTLPIHQGITQMTECTVRWELSLYKFPKLICLLSLQNYFVSISPHPSKQIAVIHTLYTLYNLYVQ